MIITEEDTTCSAEARSLKENLNVAVFFAIHGLCLINLIDVNEILIGAIAVSIAVLHGHLLLALHLQQLFALLFTLLSGFGVRWCCRWLLGWCSC